MLSKPKSPESRLMDVNLSGSGIAAADDTNTVQRNIALGLQEYLGKGVKVHF
jgi:hypothetical protein